MPKLFFYLLIVFLIMFEHSAISQITLDLNKIAGDFLMAVKMNKPKETENAMAFLEGLDTDQLVKNLDTDEKKKSFWINIYNGYIILQLANDSTVYEDRGAFFSEKTIKIAHQNFSFDFIEHGILRRSKMKLSLGFFGKLFPSKLERQLRVDKLDYRIHFALNCGAASCPPVAFYSADKIDEQLNIAEASFVLDQSTYDEASNTVTTTAIFSWFRGDFGRKRGIRKIIRRHLEIENKRFSLKFRKYDWGMDITNFKATKNEPIH